MSRIISPIPLNTVVSCDQETIDQSADGPTGNVIYHQRDKVSAWDFEVNGLGAVETTSKRLGMLASSTALTTS